MRGEEDGADITDSPRLELLGLTWVCVVPVLEEVIAFVLQVDARQL